MRVAFLVAAGRGGSSRGHEALMNTAANLAGREQVARGRHGAQFSRRGIPEGLPGMAGRSMTGTGIPELLDRASQDSSAQVCSCCPILTLRQGSVGSKVSTPQSCLSCFYSC